MIPPMEDRVITTTTTTTELAAAVPPLATKLLRLPAATPAAIAAAAAATTRKALRRILDLTVLAPPHLPTKTKTAISGRAPAARATSNIKKDQKATDSVPGGSEFFPVP